MLKKSISLAVAMAFTMNLAAMADEHGHHFHKQQVQQLSARLHVLPSCTLTKNEDGDHRTDFNFRELDATGTDADDAYSPENSSLKYECSKWTHPRLALSDGNSGGDGHKTVSEDRRGGGEQNDSKNFYLVNHDDKIAFTIWTEYGFQFENSHNPRGDGALSLHPDSEGQIQLKAKLAPFHGRLVPGHYHDVVTATLFY